MKPEIDQPIEDWLNWLLGLHTQEIDLGLSRVKSVAEEMGLLMPSAKVITVAGTNGKGSSVAMLASIYRQAGYRVGHYTSPHLLRFNERIQINQMPVSDLQIKQAFDAIERARGKVKLTYFEFATLAALWIFAQAEVEVMVLEVGLGGRLDAVNIIDADAALITAIDVDHIDWLGSDREKIGVEKAGILRPQQWAVTSDPNLPKSVLDVVTSLGTTLLRLPQDFEFQPTLKKNKNCQNPQSCQDFIAHSPLLKTLEMIPEPALKGVFQWQNLAGVIATVQGLISECPVKDDDIREGIQKVSHPGRLQWVQSSMQRWLLDVAHNAQSAEMLKNYVQSQNLFFPHAVFSVLADKDALPMLSAMVPFVEHWHIAPVQQFRAMSAETMLQLFQTVGVPTSKITEYATIADAVKAVNQLNEEDDPCLSFGSFFTVGESLEALNIIL